MLGTGWLTIRQAQEALKNGRLEEAHRLLGQSGAQGHKRSWELLHQVALGFVQRGERHLGQDDPEAAWNDLLLAEQVGLADDSTAVRLRQALSKIALEAARSLVEAGDPARALEAVAHLRERFVRLPELQLLEDAAREWTKARELADRGEFTLGLQGAERLKRLLPNVAAVTRFEQELNQRRDTCTGALVELHEAIARAEWRRAMEIADRILAAAPQQGDARKARARAWKVVEPATVGETRHTEAPQTPRLPDRINGFLLWIDGIGGYLVCLDNRVTIGQATPEGAADIPLFADVSRIHASLTRDSEGYLLEAVRAVQVNGQPAEKVLLQSGDRVTLGTSCQMQFRQPVPVSATARLDLTSGHRLALAVDAVLLMAETLVMGAGSQVHIAIPELNQPVVLFRQKNGLGVRHAGAFSIDGQRCQERGTLGASAKVSADDFTFAVEPVGTTRTGRT